MYLVQMRPEEIKEAVAENIPVLMAAGVVEYHGPHLPIGTDFLIADAITKEVEKRCRCVLAPPFPFGPTMSWAGGPEEGEVDFAPEPLFLYTKEVLKGLMEMGFRRIYILQHHQGAEGLQSLCLRRAAAELIREVGRSWGPGWGRNRKEELPNPKLFSLIKVAGLATFSTYPSPDTERVSTGHAGKGETQLIMAILPHTVRLESLDSFLGKRPPWLEDAEEADAEVGKKWLEFCIEGWVRELSKK